MRWSETEYARYLEQRGILRPHAQPVTEKVFMGAILTMARREGWLAFHTYRSTKSAEGFPDVVLAPGPTLVGKGHPLYVCELKTETGIVSAAQQAWLTALAGCTGVISEIWRPSMFAAIVAQLRR